jgi:hypothetical protein
MCEKMMDKLCMSDDIKGLAGVFALPPVVQKVVELLVAVFLPEKLSV